MQSITQIDTPTTARQDATCRALEDVATTNNKDTGMTTTTTREYEVVDAFADAHMPLTQTLIDMLN